MPSAFGISCHFQWVFWLSQESIGGFLANALESYCITAKHFLEKGQQVVRTALRAWLAKKTPNPRVAQKM